MSSSSASARSRLVRAALLLALGYTLARTAALLYSAAATDIQYAEGWIPDALYYLRRLLTAASFSVGVAASAALAWDGLAGKVALIHGGILLLDTAAAFVIDACSGAVSGAALWLAAALDLAQFLFGAVFVTANFLISSRAAKKERSLTHTCLLLSALWMAGQLLLQSVSVFSFLAEIDFAPYAIEVTKILLEYLMTVLLHGGVTFLASLLFVSLFPSAGERSERFPAKS